RRERSSRRCQDRRRQPRDYEPPGGDFRGSQRARALTAMGRPVFALRVQAESGVHVFRALRAWLKIGLRTFGLRCVSIEEVKQKETNMVDMRKYASGYVMPDDLRDGPRQEQIINVYISEKHDVPVLEFASGDQLFAWPSIARVLTHAYGFESDN